MWRWKSTGSTPVGVSASPNFSCSVPTLWVAWSGRSPRRKNPVKSSVVSGSDDAAVMTVLLTAGVYPFTRGA
jgi:hypothetical protein